MEELYCLGCGVKLQCENVDDEGYVDPNAFNREFVLCKRCYQLKHYGKFTTSNIVKNSIRLLHENAKKDDIIVLICDVSLTICPLTKALLELNYFQNVILIANRYDLYKDYISPEKALKFLKNEAKRCHFKFKKYFLVDNNIEEIFNYLDDNSLNKDIYVIGLENAGKTTFLNKILTKIANEKNDYLTNSKYPGTTIDLVKINLTDNNYIIDSPGIKSKGNFMNLVSKEFIKNYDLNKIKATSFQINENQSIIISNILKLDFKEGNRQTIIYYGSNMLEITRCKLEKSKKTFNNLIKDLKLKEKSIDNLERLEKKPFKIKDNEKYDLVIEGLGFFSLTQGTYNLYCLKGVNAFLRKSMI